MCDQCHSFPNENSSTEEQISAYDKHNVAREFKNNDKVIAQKWFETVLPHRISRKF